MLVTQEVRKNHGRLKKNVIMFGLVLAEPVYQNVRSVRNASRKRIKNGHRI